MKDLNDNLNLTPEQKERLLSMAGKKLGQDPQALRAQVEGGQLDGLLGGLPAEKQAQVARLMNDPEAMQQFVQNPMVQKLLGGLLGKK